MTKNDLQYQPQMRRGSFNSFAKEHFNCNFYDDREVADKFYSILKKVCLNHLDWNNFEFKDILSSEHYKLAEPVYVIDDHHFEDVLSKSYKKGSFNKPEKWQDLKIYEIVRKLFEISNKELDDFIKNDAFRAGSFFIDMKENKVDLLISLGSGQLARIPAERMTFDTYLDMRYPDRVKEALKNSDDVQKINFSHKILQVLKDDENFLFENRLYKSHVYPGMSTEEREGREKQWQKIEQYLSQKREVLLLILEKGCFKNLDIKSVKEDCESFVKEYTESVYLMKGVIGILLDQVNYLYDFAKENGFEEEVKQCTLRLA